MNITVISIRKYLDSDRDELLDSALESYRGVLVAMGSRGQQACPAVGCNLKRRLEEIGQGVTPDAGPGQIVESEKQTEKELEDWARQAAGYYKQQSEEFKELLVVVASTAEALGTRDSRYQSQFHELSGRLSKIADLDDLKQIRRSLLDSATELRNCVQQMAEDGKQAVAQLREEVQKCHSRIEEVERIAVIDPLTGLVNRRGLESAIEFRLAQTRIFCLMMLDLNGFKHLNDVYGHLAGDRVLKQFAEELKAVFRAGDSVGRWAGDEFIVVLDTRQEEANDFVARVKRWVFGEYSVEANGVKRKVRVDAAIGVTERKPDDTLASLIERADRRMYGEKSTR